MPGLRIAPPYGLRETALAALAPPRTHTSKIWTWRPSSTLQPPDTAALPNMAQGQSCCLDCLLLRFPGREVQGTEQARGKANNTWRHSVQLVQHLLLC